MRAAVVKEFNKNLRAHIKKAGITQEMLSEFSVYQLTTLGGWLNCGVQPSIDKVCKGGKGAQGNAKRFDTAEV